MPISIESKKRCTGCEACYNICPVKSVSMISDNCGFKYPRINTDTCINCERCVRVCPMLSDKNRDNSYTASVYAAWSQNEDTRFMSTSGGIFTELALAVVEQGGVVVGAAYDTNNNISHEVAADKKSLERLRQSKYAQSSIGDIYSKIKELLEQHLVLFCGSPCQVAGLINYLDGKCDNLITLDFICRGVNSPKAYFSWIAEIESRERSKVKRIWYKYKEDGWKKSPRCTRIDLVNGKTIIQKGDFNYYMMGYLDSNLYVRPSCSECIFKGAERISDITLGDFWGVKAALDDDQGTSMVRINTMKGEDLFHSITSNIEFYYCDENEIDEGNKMFKKSIAINPLSEQFLSDLGKGKSFSKMVRLYSLNSSKKKLKHTVKRILHRVRLYNP